MSTMAVSSGAAGRSSLNPNAPLFVPMAFRQVEDFSPEWYELVKTTPWFREHWFRQHQEQEAFDYDEEDVASMLPDSFDLGITDEFSEFDEAAVYYQAFEAEQQISGDVKKFHNGKELFILWVKITHPRINLIQWY